jgi:hypothetical protein
MSAYDADALAGRTFYRGVAGPGVPNNYSYIGLVNPLNSGVTVYVDAYEIWPGLPGAAAEIGILRWGGVFPGSPQVPLAATYKGKSDSRSIIWLAAYPALVNPFIDYVPVGPNNGTPSMLTTPPYPIIISPNDGIAFWNPTKGYELKVGLWIREYPIVSS